MACSSGFVTDLLAERIRAIGADLGRISVLAFDATVSFARFAKRGTVKVCDL